MSDTLPKRQEQFKLTTTQEDINDQNQNIERAYRTPWIISKFLSFSFEIFTAVYP